MSIKEQIAKLIDKYEHEIDKSQSEADLRADYIDQLFLALGWNIHNDPGQLTNYRREGYIRGAGYVDVGLEIAGQPVLMLEAKKFGVLTSSAERTYDRTSEEKQLFRYARGKKIPYCVLTNFEHLHVFNADHERLILAFDDPTEYLGRLSELQRLSPERVKSGSLPASERQLEIKDIDEAFLASLQSWRRLLANAIYQHNLTKAALQTNDEFDFSKLMAVVQRILDRIILIRYGDDKEVLLKYDVVEDILTSYHKKASYARPDDLMQELVDFSHRMDEHHNTTLFQPGHDCEKVFVPNEVLAKIMTEINNISFRKFTSDILGNTYETYLGTKLVLKNGEITSEERRDIRKAGGIFYTPTIVVHYIVDNTLGRLLKELEDRHGLHAIEKAREIKVLDPACGSGSFLIYAYQVLAGFYRRMNEEIEKERVKLLASISNTDMFQRLELFKHLPEPVNDYPHHVLEKQLYGVDIDPEAAEIAAVNLTMQAFADNRREKLPKILNENIKVGNSLISGTEEELRRYFGDDWEEKRPFNWEQEFPEVMSNGRFDVVVGNPPYMQVLQSQYKMDLQYYKDHYVSVSGFKKNLFPIFIERSLDLIKADGARLSMIIPDRFFFTPSYIPCRRKIIEHATLESVEEILAGAFNKTIVGSAIFVASTPKLESYGVEIRHQKEGQSIVINRLPIESVLRDSESVVNLLVTHESSDLLQKAYGVSSPLKSLFSVHVGIMIKDNKTLFTKSRVNIQQKPIVKGHNFERYAIKNTYFFDREKAVVFGGTKDSTKHEQTPKILLRKTGDTLVACLDTMGIFAEQSVYLLLPKSHQPQIAFTLGILNSKLMSYLFQNCLITNPIAYPYIQHYDLEKLPIRSIDFDSPSDKKLHDELVALVDKMLELNERLAPIRNVLSEERDKLLREIEHTDTKIDQKVYDLYGLTEEERKVVEDAIKKE
jgi:type I restriction-modification system DNA methylase subunit